MKHKYQSPLKLILMLLIVISSIPFLNPLPVEASTKRATIKYLNIHYTINIYYGQIGRLYVDDTLALCVEHNTAFREGVYTSGELSAVIEDEQDQKKIALIDYYGKRMNMEEDDRIYGAVQLYVWEVISKQSITSITGDLSLVEYESIKEQINRHITRHETKPSFINQSISLSEGESLELIDTHNVLNQFAMASHDTSIASVTQSGNKLTIKAHESGEIIISGQKVPHAYIGSSFAYFRGGLQTIASFNLSDAVSVSMPVTVTKARGTFQLTKLDPTGNGVQGVVFNIDGKEYTTNHDGQIILNDLEPGLITYFEVSVPEPLIIDKTKKQSKIEKGKTTVVSVINDVATGTITIYKFAEDGSPVEGVRFAIILDNRDIMQVTTNHQGIAITDPLPLNDYDVVEVDGPDYLILDSEPKKVSLVYKDENTPLVSTTLTVFNQYKPYMTINAQRIRIDTQTADKGLSVEAWFSKIEHYSGDVNDFKESEITVEIVNQTLNRVVSRKHYTAATLPTYDIFEIDPTVQGVDENHRYEVKISTLEPHKVTIEYPSIDTIGYTSSEARFLENSQSHNSRYVEGVIRTERYQGQPMLEYFERFEISVPKMTALIAGRGFHYDVSATYSNDLNMQSSITLTLHAHNELIDGDFFERGSSMTAIELMANNNDYHLPIIYARKDIQGHIINTETYDMLKDHEKEDYRYGGTQIMTPLWSSDLGEYHLKLITNVIGVHAFSITFSDSIELYAYLYGWENEHGPSPTIDQDQVLVTPIYSADANGNGMIDVWEETQIPDNWGYQHSDGTRHLTNEEKVFLGLKS